MSYTTSPQGNSVGSRPSWQDQLQDHCTRNKQSPPVFNIVSDRRGTYPISNPPPPPQSPSTVFQAAEPDYFVFPLIPRFNTHGYSVPLSTAMCLVGGRTAWSSTVTVQGQNIAARYWYDGQFINNAREDAAEVALKTLNQQPRAATVYQGQLFPQATSSGYGRGAGF
ncbi:hypothetical protein EN45_030330 [Penicillium chrysogenum]|uniref:Uncharacterized protein n=1 Tax=Penicillium chrysogenum TaxID=5076 RepID=A0A167XIT4_PENCH|nr:hypothetical protein NUH16_002434 [Penicillium rubens]KZN92869.1 hypothetical protein EN45_030330 [Penicillium chrysogenum]